jgi:hypothetical protein
MKVPIVYLCDPVRNTGVSKQTTSVAARVCKPQQMATAISGLNESRENKKGEISIELGCFSHSF